MKRKKQKKPLVSFCVSTYKRPELLKILLKAFLAQTYQNFEVVICDNDPRASSRKVVAQFHSKKLRYYCNGKNLGMIASFNRAFKLSKGELIVFNSDDDAPYRYMLADLVDLSQRYPDCVAYFGAYDLYTPDSKLAQTTKLKNGKVSCRNFDWPIGATKIFSPQDYLEKALQGDIFYYLMWSTGFVRRSVVKKVGAMAVYGSPTMTDRSYCLKIGMYGNVLIHNKELGYQLVHLNSFSLTDSSAQTLINGFAGYYKDILPSIKKFHFEKLHQEFLLRHLFNMFMIAKIGNDTVGKNDIQQLMNYYDEITKKVPFLKDHRWEMKLMLRYRFPFEAVIKAAHLPPKKLLKTTYRFFRYRIIGN